jgi:hypothetical protein
MIAFRIEAFNALNGVNLYLPNTDLSLALTPGWTRGQPAQKEFSSTSSFGKSTSAFDPRTVQASLRFTF